MLKQLLTTISKTVNFTKFNNKIMKSLLTAFAVVFLTLPAAAQEAEQIVFEYLKRNGIENFNRLQSLKFTGISDRPLRKMPFRTWMQPPNKYRAEVDMGGSSTLVQVFDGKRAWEINPVSLLEGPAWLSDDISLLLSKNFFPGRLAMYKEPGYRITNNGTVMHNQKPAFHLTLRTPDALDYDFYIDQESYLLVKYNDLRPTLFGETVKTDVEPSDYREFNGIQLPYLITYTVNNQLSKKDTITAYEINVPVDVSYPAQLPVKPKTFGFDPNHKSESKLLDLLPLVIPAARTVEKPDGRRLKPATLTYDGVHKGLHPDMVYQRTYAVNRTAIDNQKVWAITLGGADGNQNQLPNTVLKFDDLQIVRDQAVFAEGRLTYAPEKDALLISGTRRGTNEPINASVPFSIGTITLGLLDFYIAALPLEKNYARSYNLIYAREPRPFQLKVVDIETITTKAGKFDTFVVELIPLDGKKEMQSVYYMMRKAPHYVVRKKYVVFPETKAPYMPKSMGNEDLTAIEWAKEK